MRKKFLSAFLLGALAIATTSTMVSCKDYDGDISSLKDQIKSLENLVAQKESAINTSIANLQAQIDKANNDHATKAALEAARKALQDAIDANYNTLVAKDAELSAAIAKAQAAADAAAAVAAQNAQNIAANKTAIGENAAAIAQNVKDIEANAQAIQKVANDLANTNKELATLSANLDAAVVRIGKLEAGLAAQEAALAEAIKKHNADKEALEKADAENLEKALAAVADLKKYVDEADKAIKQKLAEEIAGVNERIDGVEATIDDLQEAHNAVAAKVEDILNNKIPAIEQKINDVITMVNKVDAKYDKLTRILANKLRALVYQPSLYVDGVEAIEYPYLDAPELTKTAPGTLTRKHSYEDVEVNLSNIVDYTKSTGVVVYGPAWAVPYHTNPSTTDIAYADVKGWNERETENLTRVAVGKLGISSPEKYDNGKALFANAAGTMTVGLKIANPELLKNNGPSEKGEGQTGKESYGVENIIAIQVKSQTTNKADTLITSDYAMIYGEPVVPEAIIWTKNNMRGKVNVTIDEECPLIKKVVHVFDTPQEALSNEPSFDLGWDDTKGITLSEYLASHYVRDCKTKAAVVPGTWAWGEEKAWGLHYEFETVEYKSSANTTIDSRYCKLDATTGNIQARNVETTADGGKTLDEQSMTSVGREPLVRVKLMQGKRVVLDGYILVRIVKEAVKKTDKVIEEYTTLGWKKTVDVCNAYTAPKTTWDQFSDWVLTKNLDNMTKDEFDAQYTIDGVDATPTGTPVDTKIFDCKIYKDAKGNAFTWKDAAGHVSQIGTITMTKDAEALNNHTFKLTLTEDEQEYLTHDKDLPVVVDFYVRFAGGVTAKYNYVYVKFQVTFDRTIEQSGIKEKNTEYWFALDGNDEGWDAVAYNVSVPMNGQNTTVWTSNPGKNFITNKVVMTESKYEGAAPAPRKHFFVPVNTTITDHDGVEWIITPREGCEDIHWNALACSKEICSAALCENNLHVVNAHQWPLVNAKACHVAEGTDNAKLHEILKKCAVDYTAGAFTNDALYAVKKSAYNTQVNYTKIADMNQGTGEIALDHGQAGYQMPLDMIMNAIGYEENHANISTEFHAWTGVALSNGCDVALDVYNTPGENNKTYSIWESSWQRPINFLNSEPRVVEDAEDNGEFISILDLLKFYDWRGPVKGHMDGDQTWLWAYYNISSLKIYMHPENITTDMHGGELGKTTLASRSNKVHLYPATFPAAAGVKTATTKDVAESFAFDLSAYNSSNRNNLLVYALKNDQVWKNKFGYIYYENNGDNVTDFTVRIPLDVCYEWGHFSTYVDVKIKRTQGN